MFTLNMALKIWCFDRKIDKIKSMGLLYSSPMLFILLTLCSSDKGVCSVCIYLVPQDTILFDAGTDNDTVGNG